MEFPKEYYVYMNLGTIRLRGRPRNRWQDEVRVDRRIVGREGWQEKVHNRGLEEAPENGKESLCSAHANGICTVAVLCCYVLQ